MRKQKALKNKKGFTLVEIIIVLVIIAILAAATVPAMIGYVSDARGKTYAAEARVGLTAAQAVLTEVVALSGVVDHGSFKISLTGSSVYHEKNIVDTVTFANLVTGVTGVTYGTDGIMNSGSFEITAITNNRVTGIKYYSAGNTGSTIPSGSYTVEIAGGTTTVTRNP